MAIRFYCPFCGQLLGIAQRKVGAVVECPACHGKVGVPPADGATDPAALPFEQPAPAGRPDIVLSPSQVAAGVVILLLLLALSFAAGLLLGALS
jgi:hypothetical protein